MTKPKLTLPNGLELSVGDKTNVGIVESFSNDYVFTILDNSSNHCKHEEITSVQKRYDWVNILGEADFAFEENKVYIARPDRGVFYNTALDESIIYDYEDRLFSKQSDAERYLESLKPKEGKKKDVLSIKDYIHPFDIEKTILNFAKEACKRQREICTDEVIQARSALNAPEPKME